MQRGEGDTNLVGLRVANLVVCLLQHALTVWGGRMSAKRLHGGCGLLQGACFHMPSDRLLTKHSACSLGLGLGVGVSLGLGLG